MKNLPSTRPRSALASLNESFFAKTVFSEFRSLARPVGDVERPPGRDKIGGIIRLESAAKLIILELNTFVEISLGIASADFKRLAANYIGRWDLVHLRCSNFMSCTLAERLALTLLELSENFGVPDRRGVRLTVPARHKHLAELVGASRPRVTEHLMAFERAHMIVRTAGHMVVKREQLESFLTGAHRTPLRTPYARKAA